MASPQPASPSNRRLYVAEGGVHLYSSLPTVLTPADLYRAKQHPRLKRFVEHCNIYLIAARARIFVCPMQFSFESGVMCGRFIVARESGPAHVDFEWAISGDPCICRRGSPGLSLGDWKSPNTQTSRSSAR